jgi:hypothetical protein
MKKLKSRKLELQRLTVAPLQTAPIDQVFGGQGQDTNGGGGITPNCSLPPTQFWSCRCSISNA